jgi:hypothetical protein
MNYVFIDHLAFYLYMYSAPFWMGLTGGVRTFGGGPFAIEHFTGKVSAGDRQLDISFFNKSVAAEATSPHVLPSPPSLQCFKARRFWLSKTTII